MEKLFDVETNKSCRTCMRHCEDAESGKFSNETILLHSIYDFVNDSEAIRIPIYELLNCAVPKLPKIEILDELPKMICTQCLDKLNACNEFQNCCIKSDLRFRNSMQTALIQDNYKQNNLTDPLHCTMEGLVKQEIEADNGLNISLKEKDEVITETINEIVDCTMLKPAFDAMDASDTNEADEEDLNEITPVYDKKEKKCFKCEICELAFTVKHNLQRHMMSKHKIDARNKLRRSSKLKNNINKERKSMKDKALKEPEISLPDGNEGNAECFTSETKSDIKSTSKYNYHSKIKPCELCDQTYNKNTKLLEHYTNVHPERLYSTELPVPEALKHIYCPYCKKGVKHARDHIRTHTKDRPFLCSHCGKSLSTSSSLAQHLLRHTNEKRYECTECPKRFTALSDLCSHRHTHKTERPHVCDICGKGFQKTERLTIHKRIHGEKKFKCEHCGRDFISNKLLRRHTLTHTGEKPYKCKYCDNKSFAQSNDLIKHVRVHLGENVYQCELCPAAFPKDGDRRKHFATHKDDDEETRERYKLALIEAQEKLRQKLELDKITAANSSKN